MTTTPAARRDDRIQFRSRDLAPAIAARTAAEQSPNEIVYRDLARYYAALARELPALALSPAEAHAILDTLNGTRLDPPETARYLWAELSDACRLNGLATTWEIDGDALVAKLRALSLLGSLAVIDAAERYWAAVARGEAPTPESVGLRT